MPRIPNVSAKKLTATTVRALVRTANPVILDIGANDGSSTLAFLNQMPGAHVYAFEPDERALDRFAGQVSDDRVTLIKSAVSDRDGETTFHCSSGLPDDDSRERMERRFPNGWDLSGSIREPKEHLDHPWITFEETTTVATTRLDSWYAGLETPPKTIDFVWADVQGAEAEMIAGGRETLDRTRYLYTEYSWVESYAGQALLPDLLKLIPNFKIMRRYQYDVLLCNMDLR